MNNYTASEIIYAAKFIKAYNEKEKLISLGWASECKDICHIEKCVIRFMFELNRMGKLIAFIEFIEAKLNKVSDWVERKLSDKHHNTTTDDQINQISAVLKYADISCYPLYENIEYVDDFNNGSTSRWDGIYKRPFITNKKVIII